MLKELVKNEIHIKFLFPQYEKGFFSIKTITSEESSDDLKLSIFSNKLKEEFTIFENQKNCSLFKLNLFFSLEDDLIIKKNKDFKLNIFYEVYEGVKNDRVKRNKKIKKANKNVNLKKKKLERKKFELNVDKNKKEISNKKENKLVEKEERLSKIDWFIKKNQDLIENKNPGANQENKELIKNGNDINKGIFRALLNSKKELVAVTENKNLFEHFKNHNYYQSKKKKRKFMR